MKKRIVIVDKDTSMRDMMAYTLNSEPPYEVVGDAGTGLRGMEVCMRLRPDLMIIDLVLPELSGTEVMRRMTAALPFLRVLVFSGTSNQELIVEALKCKPHGFVAKQESFDTLRQAISTVSSGGSYFTACASGNFSNIHPNAGGAHDLTAREREILQLVAEGRSNKEISCRLGVTNKTVENHRSHMMDKLGIHDIASLTRYAVRHGIIALD